MAVKMGYEKDADRCCTSCKATIKNSKEMYKMGIGLNKSSLVTLCLCDKCLDDLMHKILQAQCMFNGRVKSQAELARFAKIDRVRRGEVN